MTAIGAHFQVLAHTYLCCSSVAAACQQEVLRGYSPQHRFQEELYAEISHLNTAGNRPKHLIYPHRGILGMISRHRGLYGLQARWGSQCLFIPRGENRSLSGIQSLQ